MGDDLTVDIWGEGGAIAKLNYFCKLFLNILGLFLKARYSIGIFLGAANVQLF